MTEYRRRPGVQPRRAALTANEARVWRELGRAGVTVEDVVKRTTLADGAVRGALYGLVWYHGAVVW
jgi:hypothetical protein